MLTYQEPEPVLEALRALDEQDYVAFKAFGAGEEQSAAGKQNPFYLAADPVAAFMKALQRSLGVPVTGNWNRATHEALGAWFHQWEVANESGTPATAIPAWGESPEDNMRGFMEAIEIYAEANESSFAQALGFASRQVMMNDSQWLVNKDQVAAAILAHMIAEEAAAVAVVPVADCPSGQYKNAAGQCVDIPPTVDVRPIVQKVWYRRTSTWLIAGGVLLVGGILIAASRKG